MRVLHGDHACGDGPVAGELLVGEPELVRGLVDVGTHAAHPDLACRLLQEGDRTALQVDGQGVRPPDQPGLRNGPLPVGLRVERRLRVVVPERHGLPASLGHGPLRIGRVVMAYDGPRAVAGIAGHAAVRIVGVAGAPLPHVVDPIALVVIGLEVLHGYTLDRGEAPHRTGPGRRGGLIDLVHFPVVRPAALPAQGGQAHLLVRHALGQDQGVRVRPEVDLVTVRQASGTPRQHCIQGHVRCARGGCRLPGLCGDVEEPDLAEAVDHAPTPVAQAGQLQILGLCAGQIHGGVVRVVVQAGRLGELGDVRDGRPGGPVCGDLDLRLLDAVPHDLLYGLVGVPDPHPVQLEDAVELVLDPGRLRAGLAADPHVGDGDRVLIRERIQPPAVDRVGRSHRVIHGAGGGGLDRRSDRIAIGLGGEAPDLALVDRAACRRGDDLIDPPVVGPAEVEHAREIAGSRCLPLGDEQGAARGCGIDLIEAGAEVHVVGLGKISRRPTESDVSLHVLGTVGWHGVAAVGVRGRNHQGLDFAHREHVIIEPHIVDVALEGIGSGLRCSDPDRGVRIQAESGRGAGPCLHGIAVGGDGRSVEGDRQVGPLPHRQAAEAVCSPGSAPELDEVSAQVVLDRPVDLGVVTSVRGSIRYDPLVGGPGPCPLDPAGDAHLLGVCAAGGRGIPFATVHSQAAGCAEPQCAAEPGRAVHPVWSTSDGPIVAVAGHVFDGRTLSFVQGPVSHQAGHGRAGCTHQAHGNGKRTRHSLRHASTLSDRQN